MNDESDVARWRRLLHNGASALEQKEKLQLHQYLEQLKSKPPGETKGTDADEPGPQIQFPGPVTVEAPLGQLDDYDILAELGCGAFGTVFKGFDRTLHREVAIKVLNPDHAAVHRDRKRFQQEARAVSSLQHDHIVRIYDVCTASQLPLPYLVMELVNGQTLAEHLAGKSGVGQGMFQPREAAGLVKQVALALSAAHDVGLVHRDIKSSNIVVENGTGRAKLTDFGLARQTLTPNEMSTHSGRFTGTLPYMSPEQVLVPDQVDARSDLYSLGVVLYELLTGERPFRGTSSALLMQVVHDDPQPPRRLNPALPRDLETICLKCLAKEPSKRYASAVALADELQRFLTGEPIRARPVLFWERVVKWAKRKPNVAALLAAVVLVTISGFAGVTWQWVRAESSRGRAIEAANAAETSRKAAVSAADSAEAARQAERAERERVERSLYAHDISLAYHEYLTRNATRALQLLDGTRPDLRNWEWRFLNRFCREDVRTLSGHSAVVQNLEFSPDGEVLASISRGLDNTGEVKVWDATTGAERYTLPDHAGWMMDLAFSPDGKRLATTSSSSAGGVRIWDTVHGLEHLAIALDGDAHGVEFSPDGRLFAIGQHNGRIVLHDSVSGAEVLAISAHKSNVHDLAFSPDGKLLASAGKDGTASIWDASDGRRVHFIDGLADARAVAFSPDGHQLAIGAWSGAIKILHLTAHGIRETPVRPVHTSVMQLRWRPDAEQLAVLTGDGGLQLWDPDTLRLRRSFSGHHCAITFSPNGRRLATAGLDRQVRLLDLTSPETQPSTFRVLPPDHQISDIAFGHDSRLLAIADRVDKALLLWDLSTQRLFKRCQGHSESITCVAFSPNGRRLASSSTDKTVKLWEAATGKNLRTFDGHTDVATSVSFHPYGARVISASRDRKVKVWDVETGVEVLALDGRATENLCVASQPGGRPVAAASLDGVIQLWDGDTGDMLAEWRGHSRVGGLAFDPNGRLLASCGDDALVQLWDIAAVIDGEIAPHRVLPGHTAEVTTVSFSPDGERLASAGRDRAVKLWDVGTGNELLGIREYVAPIARVRFSPDGRWLVLSANTAVFVWDSGDKQSRLALVNQAHDAVQLARTWHAQQAQACERAKRWFGAAFHWNQLASLEPNNWRHLERRGNAYVAIEQWDKAAAAFDQAAALGAGARLEYNRAVLYLRANDADSYRAICASLLEKFGNTGDGATANNVAWTCLLSATSSVDPDRLVLLAEKAVAQNRTTICLNTLGAALYRAGRDQDAINTLVEAIRVHGRSGTPSDWLFLAMAHHSLGRTDDAQQWLDKAARWIDLAIKQQESGGSVEPFFTWNHQIELAILRREADELLGIQRAAQMAPHQ